MVPRDGQQQFGFCFLKDQRPLSEAAFAQARQLAAQIHNLIEQRPDYLAQLHDPEIFLPAGNWKLDHVLGPVYRIVAGCDYSVLNHLRLFTLVFTGFNLLTMSGKAGQPLPTRVPDDADEQLANLAWSPGPVLDLYLETARHLPDCLHITPPHAFGEVGWIVDGKLINHDTYAYLERIALLAECGQLWELRQRCADGPERPRILEIGPGFGGLAFHLKKLIPQARYFCVDLPESLLFSSIYLSALFEGEDHVLVAPDRLDALDRDSAGFTFLPNYLFDECVNGGLKFDLIVNTLSMSEMSARQVRHYATQIGVLLGGRGVFFEQNQDNRQLGMLDARTIVAEVLPCCLPLRSVVIPRLSQGSAHLWAAQPVSPYGWSRSEACYPRLEEKESGFNLIRSADWKKMAKKMRSTLAARLPRF